MLVTSPEASSCLASSTLRNTSGSTEVSTKRKRRSLMLFVSLPYTNVFQTRIIIPRLYAACKQFCPFWGPRPRFSACGTSRLCVGGGFCRFCTGRPAAAGCLAAAGIRTHRAGSTPHKHSAVRVARHWPLCARTALWGIDPVVFLCSLPSGSGGRGVGGVLRGLGIGVGGCSGIAFGQVVAGVVAHLAAAGHNGACGRVKAQFLHIVRHGEILIGRVGQ